MATVFFRNRPSPDPADVLTSSQFTPDGAGDWAGDVVIPDGLDPAPEYFLSGQCADRDRVIVLYDFHPFDVTPAPPAPPATAVAPAATPVSAAPRFAG